MYQKHDEELTTKDIIEQYCDRSTAYFPRNKEELMKVANRMRMVGLLNDKELRDVEMDADKIVRERQ